MKKISTDLEYVDYNVLINKLINKYDKHASRVKARRPLTRAEIEAIVRHVGDVMKHIALNRDYGVKLRVYGFFYFVYSPKREKNVSLRHEKLLRKGYANAREANEARMKESMSKNKDSVKTSV